MPSSDRWINKIAMKVLNLDDGNDIDRVTIDARRGEAVSFQVYVKSILGETEILEIRKSPVTDEYEAVVITGGEEFRIA